MTFPVRSARISCLSTPMGTTRGDSHPRNRRRRPCSSSQAARGLIQFKPEWTMRVSRECWLLCRLMMIGLSRPTI